MGTNYGLQEFSTQEAVNFEAYKDWNWEILDLSTDETDVTSTYITADNPAKKIVLYIEPNNQGLSSLEVNDVPVSYTHLTLPTTPYE